MRPGYLNGIDVNPQEASSQIKRYQAGITKRKKLKDFNVWASIYAAPGLKGIYTAPFRLETSKDAGAKAIAEVKKISDKLLAVKKEQVSLSKKSRKAISSGTNKSEIKELEEAEKGIAKKASTIKKQLSTRVSEGISLAKAKREGERIQSEVSLKKQFQISRYPHLVSIWAKHDALYERNRSQMIQKHDLVSLKDSQLEQYLKTLPRSREKDAKIERHRKKSASRRVSQTQELARLDNSEAGRLDAREATSS